MTTALGRWRSPLPWLAGLLVVYLLSPIGDFLGRLATTSRIASPGAAAALAVSAETATIATAVIAVLGVPLAYLLAQGRSRRSVVVGVAVQLPIALPPLMSGIMLLYLVGPYSPVGRLFGGRLTDDRVGIVLAQIFVSAPFLVIAARSAFAAIPPELDEVAATLGHRRFARFTRVAVPAAMPGIVAGLLLAWLRGFGEFGATVVLAYHPYSLPVFTYVQFGSTGLAATLLPTAAALATAVVVLLGSAAAAHYRLPTRLVRRAPAAVAGTAVRRRDAEPLPLSFEVRARVGGFTVQAAASTRRCLAVLGVSGAGKTLTLRALAGLTRLDAGGVHLGGRDLTVVPVERRRIGYLPQDPSLLPQLPVREQVGFAAGAEPAATAYWIDRLQLVRLLDRRPDQLSGGQRRRVGLARALACHPQLLLLDEPLTGLDTPSRDELRRVLRTVLAEAAITTVVVTHDPADVAMLAEDVAVLDRGELLQAGPVAAVCRCPVSPLVARLLGIPNAVAVTVGGPGRVITVDGTLFTVDTAGLPAGTPAVAMLDPAGLRLGPGGMPVRVVDVVDFPTHRVVEVTAGTATPLVVHTSLADPDTARLRPHDRAGLRVRPGALRLSVAGGGEPGPLWLDGGGGVLRRRHARVKDPEPGACRPAEQRQA